MSGAPMREIRVRFTGDARDLQRATQDVSRDMVQVSRAIDDSGRSMRNLGTASSDGARGLREVENASRGAHSSARELAGELGRLATQYVTLAAAVGAFAKGIGQNAEIESLKLGMATIVSANEKVADAQGKQVEGAAKLAVAQGQVADVFARMKVDAINTTATLPELAAAFNAALAPAMAMGISLDDTRKLTVQMVQAMGAMSIPLDQARQEINSILQGQISQDSQLGKNLGINNEMVKSWQAQGTLVEHLNEKLKDFAVAGEAAGKTWAGATSTLMDNLGATLGTLTGPAFDTLKDRINSINGLFGPDSKREAAEWGGIINDSLRTAIDLAAGVGNVLMVAARGFKEGLGGVQIAGAKLGGAWERDEQVRRLVSDLPDNDGGRNPGGISRVQKAALSGALQLYTPGDESILTMAAGLGVPRDTYAKLQTGLRQISERTGKAVDDQINEILSQADKAIADAAKDAKAKGARITPNKAAAPAPKGPKTPSASTLEYLLGRNMALDLTGDLAVKAYATGGLEELGLASGRDRFGYRAAPVLDDQWRSAVAGVSIPSVYGGLRVGDFEMGGKTRIDSNTMAGANVPQKAGKDARGGIDEIKYDSEKLGKRQADLTVRYWDVTAEAAKKIADQQTETAKHVAGSAIELIGTLAAQAASGHGVSGGDVARGAGGLAASAASLIPGYGWLAAPVVSTGSNFLGGLMDAEDQRHERVKALDSGTITSRNEVREALKDKYRTSDFNLGFLRVTNYDDKAINDGLADFDAKNRERLFAQFEKGAGGDRHRAMIGLEDELKKMREAAWPEADINAYRTAKTAEIDATYELAKAADEAAHAATRFSKGLSASQGILGFTDAQAAFGIGPRSEGEKRTDYTRALSFAGFQNQATNGALDEVLGHRKELFGIYQSLIAEPDTKSGIGAQGIDEWFKKLGIAVNPNETIPQLLQAFQSTLIPILKDLAPAATQDVAELANPDTALTLAAPETRMITNNNQFVVQSQAFMGSKADARAFAQMMWGEIQTMLQQTA